MSQQPPKDKYKTLHEENVAVASKVVPDAKAGRQMPAETSPDRLTAVQVRELMTLEPIAISPSEPIQLAARRMHEHHISCLPVVEQGQLVGLVTEADFVGRVVAEGLANDQPLSVVMTKNPLSVLPEQTVFDVLTLMTRHRIAHMPVCIEGQLVGIVTQTDVIRHQIASSVFMVGDIMRMKTSEEIAGIVDQLPRLLRSLVDDNCSSFETGKVISSITDAVTRRLLQLAEELLGPPPIAYLWLACGSQGRQEQTGATDQDNCLILDDQYEVAVHGEYFTRLADFTCDGLNESGYVYCPGDMMASNEKWRQPVSVWRDYYLDWIRRPGPTAQMLASVMFDLRAIHGDVSLFEPLRQEVQAEASANSIFIAHMTSNSMTHRPPLGWFGRLKTESNGINRGKIDLKHSGVVPIVDIARLYALSAALPVVNTVERLIAGVESDVLSQSGAKDLSGAYETISIIRLKHQARQIRRSETPDNYIDPASLDSLDRDRLRRALHVVKDIQTAMSSRVAIVGR